MPSLSESINRVDVASWLDMDITGHKTKCPQCQVDLLTYQDNILDTEWVYCHRCFDGGDWLQFAANIRQEPLAQVAVDAVNRFRYAVSESSVDEYLAAAAKQKAIRSWFKEAAESFNPTDEIATRILDAMGILRLPSRIMWQERLPSFVGYIDSKTAINQLEQLGIEPTKAAIPGKSKVEHYAVLPVYGAHNRVDGLLLVNPGSPDKITHISTGNTTVVGLVGNIFDHTQLSSIATCVVDDPAFLIKLHVEHAQDDPVALPVFSIPHRKYMRGRRMHGSIPMHFGNADVVLATRKLSSDMIELAIRHNVNLLFNSQNLDDLRPAAFVTAAYEASARWDKLLGEELCMPSTRQIASMLSEVRVDNDLLARAKPRLPEAGFRRLLGLKKQSETHVAIVDGKEVVEIENQWFTGKQRQCISDAILIIERIVYRPSSDETLCFGKVRYKNREFRFCERLNKLENSALTWMRNLILKESSQLTQFVKSWNARAFRVATSLRAPKIETREHISGWLPDKKIIELGGYSISENTIAASTLPTKPECCKQVFDAVSMKKSNNDCFDVLAEPPAYLYWFTTAVASVAGDFVANTPRKNLAVVGAYAADMLVDVLPKFGMPVYARGEIKSATQLKSVIDDNRAHNWPVGIVPDTKALKYIADAANNATYGGIVAAVPTEWAYWLNLSRSWIVLDISEAEPPAAAESRLMESLFAGYARRMPIAADMLSPGKLASNHMALINACATSSFKFSVRWSRKDTCNCLSYDKRAAAMQNNLLSTLFIETTRGNLGFDNYENHRANSKSLYYVTTTKPAAVWIPMAAIEFLRNRKKLPIPSNERITAILTDVEHGSTLLNSMFNYESGWLIRHNVWEKCVLKVRAAQSKEVKVIP